MRYTKVFLWSLDWSKGSFPAKFFAQLNKVGTDGEVGGEYSLFEFNPCFASREARREKESSETLNFDSARARCVESRTRTFAFFVRFNLAAREE